MAGVRRQFLEFEGTDTTDSPPRLHDINLTEHLRDIMFHSNTAKLQMLYLYFICPERLASAPATNNKNTKTLKVNWKEKKHSGM